ncbi:MAG: single-stranded-DNA-specific exonuclease RecJ [Deltaproteobacteria bacterium]|nr:MAG: single-stranded-DNA-specific exonuclease RecJ [Deltaproteobacteria bacterium]
MLEGYGLKREHLKRAKEKGVSLVVTVDCGISDIDEVEEATSYGLDVIVTDHHTVKGDIPPAHAVLNPKRPDCSYPMRDLAGVGVVFVLVCVLRRMMRERGLFRGKSEPNLLRYLDLVAIGTVADIVPLLGDNRIYVRYGLEEIRRNPRPGVSALLDVAGVRREYFDEVDIGFRLGPRLNAAGRMGNSFLSSLILVEESPLRAMEMARLLAEQNTERQSVEGAILREAERALERIELEDRRTIVLWQEGWHPGVIGIVASRILERYGRPTIIFSLEGAEARGSARSLPGVNIMELLKRCERWIETYGGHAQAAGLVVRRSNLESFARALEEEARGIVRGEDLEREICIDGEVTLDELTERFFSEVSLLAPFGEGNQEPLFLARGAKIVNYEKKRNYTSFRVSQNGVVQDVISSFLPDGISAGDRVDILFSPRESGRGRGKLFLRDLTPS